MMSLAGVQAVPGDYDGDGTDDLAVFDPNTGRWFIRTLSGTPLLMGTTWGFPGARAVSGDYDGDGTSDLAIFDAVVPWQLSLPHKMTKFRL